jgi:peptide/nickel transport system permease protein
MAGNYYTYIQAHPAGHILMFGIAIYAYQLMGLQTRNVKRTSRDKKMKQKNETIRFQDKFEFLQNRGV